MLTKEDITQGFETLNEELKQVDIVGDIVVFGGAYMVLALDARPATRDVDAIFKPAKEIRDAALKVADTLGLPNDWINDGIKGFMSAKSGEHGTKVLNLSHLKIWCPKPEYILAMKCMASRPETHDKEDILTLIEHLKLTSADQVFKVIVQYYPQKTIPVKTQYFIEEIFEDI